MTTPFEPEISSAQPSIWEAAPVPDREGDHESTSVSEEYERCEDVWALLFRDGLDYPISHLAVRVDIPGMDVVEATTNEEGVVVLPAPKSFEGEATVSVQGLDGNLQEACKLDLAQCETGAVIQSPKVAVPMETKTRSHAMAQAASAPSAPASTSIAQTAPGATHPVATLPAPTEKTTPTATSSAQNGKEAKPATSSTPAKDCAASPPPTGKWYEVNQALEKAWVWLTGRVHESDKKQPACGAATSSAKKPSISSQHVVKESASTAGNPVTVVVGPECPSKDNLRLGRNNIYREAILNAAKRCNLIPQAMAALIDAEAAKKKESIPVLGADGKPVIIQKTGKPKVKIVREQWDTNSYNADSLAGGLTQFIESTWLGHVMVRGRYIHEQSIEKGWVKKEKDAKGKTNTVFVLADGKTTAQPWKHTSDANVQACLKQRFNAEWSIIAAADYAKTNLDLLAKKFNLKDLNDAEKAKLIYLLHHEGEGNGPLFIRNELHLMPKKKYASPEARLRSIFVGQFKGQVGAKEIVEEKIRKTNGNVQKAYRIWLEDYINNKIKLDRFCCDQSKMPTVSDAFNVFQKIGGQGV